MFLIFMLFIYVIYLYVKNSLSLNYFKSGLEDFKNKCVSLGLSGQGNFWELSGEVLKRIEGNDYIENKEKHNEYLKLHPFVAKKVHKYSLIGYY